MAQLFHIFVAHPYKAFPMDDYRAALKDLENSFKGVRFVYADEEITSDYILEKIEKMILAADLSLFDVTSWNPNVALELGLAYALKRKFYILFNPQHDGNEVPSDIRGIERIEYGSLSQLKSKLSIVLAKIVKVSASDVSSEYDAMKEKIKDYLSKSGPVGISKIETDLYIKQAVARPILAELKEAGQVVMDGKKKGAKYRTPGVLD
jgi:predicted nucleotide-binding protein